MHSDKRFIDRGRSEVSHKEIIEDNNLRIIGVCIFDGVNRRYMLPCPSRHSDLISLINSRIDADFGGDWDAAKQWIASASQGFYIEDGRFIDRMTGASLVALSGDIDKLKWPPLLYSEDLW